MSVSERIAKAEETTRVAYEIIAREADKRDQKTARLKAARLEQEARARKEKKKARA